MPLEVNEGQTPLAAAVSFFDEEPDRFRGLLVDAELPDVAAQVQNAELCNAAQQIRSMLEGTCPPRECKEPRGLACGSSG